MRRDLNKYMDEYQRPLRGLGQMQACHKSQQIFQLKLKQSGVIYDIDKPQKGTPESSIMELSLESTNNSNEYAKQPAVMEKTKGQDTLQNRMRS
jgi:hypothetical protein